LRFGKKSKKNRKSKNKSKSRAKSSSKADDSTDFYHDDNNTDVLGTVENPGTSERHSDKNAGSTVPTQNSDTGSTDGNSALPPPGSNYSGVIGETVDDLLP